ncbi:MAG: N-acetylneuraminate synthase, partial [Magnetococcales bacterium]|nr:N-acetylneuraminate synthase [Magnetococcales bacterium]
MSKVFIIAEAGVNHNGDLQRAVAMVDCAAAAGADAVKFQTFKAENLVTAQGPKAAYQQQATGTGSQLEMLKALELSQGDHFVLAQRCREKKIEFLSTPFDLPSLRFLVDEGLINRIKIPSGELTNGPLLFAAAQTGKPLIVSTGMAHPEEIAMALRVIDAGLSGGHPSALSFALESPTRFDHLAPRIILLHCTTAYPTPMNEVNLRAMVTLKNQFGTAVGYSDHTQGITMAIAATALGAQVVEKHFTLDRHLEGPDHRASIEPGELIAMVAGIRDVEAALGDGNKRPRSSELENAKVARKSLLAAIPIAKGTLFDANNLAIKRPGGGRSPMDYWSLLGTPAQRDYQP